MRSTVRKEETMPDFMYGVCVGAEPERSAPSRPLFGVLGASLHDPEVPAKPTRRRFSAEYKKNILQEAKAGCARNPRF